MSPDAQNMSIRRFAIKALGMGAIYSFQKLNLKFIFKKFEIYLEKTFKNLEI